MSLRPCPECANQVSTMARFCPKCGYPFDISFAKVPRSEQRRVSRPLGLLLGIALCVIGVLLLSPRSVVLLPFHFAGALGSVLLHPYRQWETSLYFMGGWHLWQIVGFGLLALGVLQLVFGSTKLKAYGTAR